MRLALFGDSVNGFTFSLDLSARRRAITGSAFLKTWVVEVFADIRPTSSHSVFSTLPSTKVLNTWEKAVYNLLPCFLVSCPTALK